MLPDNWPALALTADVDLAIVSEMPPLDPITEAAVARQWANATSRRPDLFNGRVFSADTVTAARIAGHWTEYRRIIAQMADPTLFPALGVRSLAVCGILSGPDGIAIARREPHSSYLAGQWQLPPAGSVDYNAACPGGADWRFAIFAELREELGLHPSDTGPLQTIAAVQHPSGVLDVAILIPTTLTAAEISARHRAQGDAEYDRLEVHQAQELIPALEAAGCPIVPTVYRFLECLANRPGHEHA